MATDAALFRSLAAMHRAGIPWPQGVASATGGDPRFATVCRELDRGTSLAEALRPVVDPLDAALLEAGERGGSLEVVLERIADAHEQENRHRRERGARTAYPVLLGHVAAVLMAVPDLIQGDVMAALGWAALVLVPLYLYLWMLRRVDQREVPGPAGAKPPDPPPAFGPWRNRIEEADARGLLALGRLYDAGVPIGDAVELAVRAGWGGRVAQDLARARRRVDRGEDLAGAWEALPSEYAGRLVSGEESGSLGKALVGVADDLRFGVEIRRQKTAQILPVILMLALGAVIALRLFSFYGNLYGRIP